MKKRIFIKPGDTFHRLTAVEYSHTGKHCRRYFKFKCACGNETTISAEAATSGNTKSCGCLAREIRRSKALPNNQGVVNQIILQYKRHARTRGLNFSLSFDEVDSIIRLPCNYCGVIGGNLKKKTKNCKDGFKHNGIDRVNSKKHYETENVVACCGTCNRAKRNTEAQAFIDWAERVTKHQKAISNNGNPME